MVRHYILMVSREVFSTIEDLEVSATKTGNFYTRSCLTSLFMTRTQSCGEGQGKGTFSLHWVIQWTTHLKHLLRPFIFGQFESIQYGKRTFGDQIISYLEHSSRTLQVICITFKLQVLVARCFWSFHTHNSNHGLNDTTEMTEIRGRLGLFMQINTRNWLCAFPSFVMALWHL